MGYFVANELGDVVTCSASEAIADGIEYNDAVFFESLVAAPYNYKWINEAFEYHPRPSAYHAWDGSAWFLSQALLTDARNDIWEKIKVLRQDRQYLGVKLTTAEWSVLDSLRRTITVTPSRDGGCCHSPHPERGGWYHYPTSLSSQSGLEDHAEECARSTHLHSARLCPRFTDFRS
jgi:hypothetical protein